MMVETSENGSEKFLSKQISVNIQGYETRFLAQKYSNRLFLVVTQCNSFGTLLNITKDQLNSIRPDNAEIPFSIEFLMGSEDDIYKILGKYLASIVFKDINIPILFSVALKDKSQSCFKGIIDGFKKVNVWEF